MIPKAQILDLATSQRLMPTTVEKDYVLGWLLAGIAQHTELSKWIFKGGTCLKKCFFETYRFSEDLDFTVPEESELSQGAIAAWLGELANSVESESGIQFPREGLTVEEYTNPRGRTSYQAKLTYSGPLVLPRRALQRVKFDISQDEWLGDEAVCARCFIPMVIWSHRQGGCGATQSTRFWQRRRGPFMSARGVLGTSTTSYT